MNETTTPLPDGGVTTTTADAGGDTAPTLEERLAFLEEDRKRAHHERDKAKAKARDYEQQQKEAQKLEAKQAAEAGEWKEAYNKLLANYEAVAPKVQEHESMVSYFAEQYETAVSALPEDLRDVVPEGLPIVKRLRLVERLANHTKPKATSPPVTPTAPVQGGNNIPPFGTPEYAEWQRTAPIEEVRKARTAHQQFKWRQG